MKICTFAFSKKRYCVSIGKYSWLILIFLFFFQGIAAQDMCLLQGKVLDAETALPLENVIIRAGKELHRVSRADGKFSFQLSAHNYEFAFNHIAYNELVIRIDLRSDTSMVFVLLPKIHSLGETTITGQQEKRALRGLSGGRFELDIQELRVLPKFMGNTDPLKLLQLLPGVQTSGEGNSGIFIRGGEPGHNLILWNGAPIYNASHILGAFSVFNPGHVDKFTLYKSHMPADFGGRLSSLIDVQSPDRIPEKVSVIGDVGLIASQATIAVPIARKSAFYLSGRQTYVGLAVKPLLGAMSSERGKELPFNYEFGDCNFTYVFRPDTRNKMVVNAYWGMDHLQIEDEDYRLNGRIRWWNLATSVLWEHDWSTFAHSRNTFFYSQYNNRLKVEQNGMYAELPSRIQDCGFRHNTRLRLGKIQGNAGLEYIFHVLDPQSPNVGINQKDWGNNGVQTYYTHEAAVFLNAKVNLASRLSVEAGVRYALCFQTGPFDDLAYDQQGILVDSVHYAAGRVVGFRQGWEPRFAVQYLLRRDNRLQFSYNRQYQWINLVSISGVGLPTDFWVPTSKNIPAQSSDNFCMGYFQLFGHGNYEFSMEGYYRRFRQQLEYKSALFDLFNQQYILEQSIHFGRGRAYGLEVIVKKNGGRFNGWASYTIGRSERTFLAIMNGKTFPAKHDRRHDFSLVGNYQLSNKWDLSAVFVYATGNCFTMPTGMYMMGGNLVKEYGAYNGSRLPSYHRLDIAANYWFFKRKDRESGLNFSVYNVYKRSNPLYVFIVAQPSKYTDDQIMIRTKRKRLYDILPSVSWMFKF